MTSPNLTDADLVEIYYALRRRVDEIDHGMLDDEPGEVDRPGSETALWAAHIREIITKVASSIE